MHAIKMPTLYKASETGRPLEWVISVEETDGVPYIVTRSGYVGGTITENRRAVPKGVNEGKSNEKTPRDHAIDLMIRRFEGRKEAGFVEDLDSAVTDPKSLALTPMLAGSIDHRFIETKLVFPIYVQRKYNGVRCTMYRHLGSETFMSRTNKPFTTLDFMLDDVRELFGDHSPDGELYIHGVALQNIVSLVKRKQERSRNLKWMIYDLAEPDMTYEERRALLQDLFDGYKTKYGHDPVHLELALSIKVTSPAEFEDMNRQFVSEGYEGTIGRVPNAEYRFNKRGIALYKYKAFTDSEFTIVGSDKEVYYDPKTGTHQDLILWVCSTEDGHRTFRVRPCGSVSERAEYYEHRGDYVGKMLTVRYLELSLDGVPVGNPVGLAVRDYE